MCFVPFEINRFDKLILETGCLALFAVTQSFGAGGQGGARLAVSLAFSTIKLQVCGDT